MSTDDSQHGSRPTVWIVATALFAIAAIGFAVWGFMTNSDLDDANATIDKQKTQLAAQHARQLRPSGACAPSVRASAPPSAGSGGASSAKRLLRGA